MYYKSKKITLLILGLTSLVLSRTAFAFLNDLEGPNLLVVFVLALVIYCSSLAVYFFIIPKKLEGLKRLSTMFFMQILIATVLYVCMLKL